MAKKSIQDKALIWLSVSSSLITIVTGVGLILDLFFGIFLQLTHPYRWALGLTSLFTFGLGVRVGIYAYLRAANRKDSPLGYRVDRTIHDFRLDKNDPQIFNRKLIKHITAKRDKLYVVDGRMKSDADVVQSMGTGSTRLIEPDGSGGRDVLVHYMALFSPELARGETGTVEIHQNFCYRSKPCEPEYIHTMVVWSEVVSITLQLPEWCLKPGSVRFFEERGAGRGGTDRNDLTAACLTYDEQSGLIVASPKKPRPNWRYRVAWEWSEAYLEIYSSV